jgi:NHLM bacteriocin system ABC transporter peptidase/ATP-binding protein
MILAHYGRWVPLDELSILTGVPRDGAQAGNIVRAARDQGMLADEYRESPGELRRGPLPAIVLWDASHYLVVDGHSKGQWQLNDPAVGPRVVDDEEFGRSFTGVVLRVQPGPNFHPVGRRTGTLSRLWSRLRGSVLALLYIVVAGLALVIPGLASAALIKAFVDLVLVGEEPGALAPILGLAIGVLVTTALLTWLRQRYLLLLEVKLSAVGSAGFFWHVLRLPLAFFEARSPGELSARIPRNDRVAGLIAGEAATAIVDTAVVVFYYVVLVGYSPVLALLGFAAVLVNIAVLGAVGRRRRDENLKLVQDSGAMLGSAMTSVRSIESIKASGREAEMFTRTAGLHARTLSASQRLGRASVPLLVVPPLTGWIAAAAVLAGGGLQVITGAMSLGTLIAFQQLMSRTVEPVGRTVRLGATLQEISADLEVLDDVLSDPPIAPAVVVDGPSTRLGGLLEVVDLSFGYGPVQDPVVDGISFRLQPGSRVALIGGSGSGKSTVARLIAGLYTPWAGQVLLDGRPREQWPQDVVTASVALVDQETGLFSGTVLENLTMWDAAVPTAQVVRAAQDALVHDAIVRRQDGYLTAVHEGGGNFSGGEAQRLEIARALVGDPRILILDEATSALDPATEKLIDDNLRRRGCTTLIVAHRLSTIRDCDEIIVLERGRIAERGSHEQLMSANGAYGRLFAAESAVTE